MADQDLLPSTLLRYPQLYKPCQRGSVLSLQTFWLATLDGVWQSLAIFLVGMYSVGQSVNDMWVMGQQWLVSLFFVVMFHLVMDVKRWNWCVHVGIWVAFPVFFGLATLFDLIVPTADQG